jgi:hypothetical protein
MYKKEITRCNGDQKREWEQKYSRNKNWIRNKTGMGTETGIRGQLKQI